MAKTKNQIANKLYGDDFEYLSSGEKAAVTKAFKKQSVAPARARPSAAASAGAGVKASIGRVGVNGTKTCILPQGATLQTLLDQSGYGFDNQKEKILNNDTGMAVRLDSVVEHNGTYAIAVEIKSA